MGVGDRVVVLSSERRGTVRKMGIDDYTGSQLVFVERDDLIGHPLEGLNPVPYDRDELEVCNP